MLQTAEHRSSERRAARRRALISGALALIALALALWAFWLEPRSFVVNRHTLDVPRWPAEQRGLRVALLSDLHVGSPHWTLARTSELVRATNREQPDLILLAGDYLINGVRFGNWVDQESIARVLGGLRAPLGVIAVLGNHDWWNDGERVRRAFEGQGIIVLENRAHAITRGAGRFFVVGLADELTRTIELDRAMEDVADGAPLLVLVHEPDVFARLPDRAALTLAGHTHGGQVKLPLLGRLVVPSRYGERYAAGHVVEGGRHLFVTTGVGTSIFPVRFGVPPEIAVLTLE